MEGCEVVGVLWILVDWVLRGGSVSDSARIQNAACMMHKCEGVKLTTSTPDMK